MKILRVIASMDPSSGGPCQGIRNSIPEMEKAGVINEVVCMDDPRTSYITEDPFKVVALGPSNNPWTYSTKLVSWLMGNLLKYDVVIVHGLWLYPGCAVNKAYKLIQGKKPKLYVMPHGMLDPYFQKASSRKIKALRNRVYWSLIERKLVHRAEGVLFTCEQELMLARDTFRPYQPVKELNIGYGIPEPPRFASLMSERFFESCPSVKGKKYLLFLSRIHEKKGVDLLINAYSQLKKNNPLQELPLLVIAGPGRETAYGRRMNEWIKQDVGLCKSVFFPGMLTGDAKWGAFYGCEAFVLPSHQENFGIAVVEALACSKPVLISDQVNIWKEIQTGGGGLVAKNSLKGTNNLLNSWATLPEKEQELMGLKAKETFKAFFAIQTHALKLLKAIS